MKNISLDKQIYIYSVDTSHFYNEEESKLHRRLNKNNLFKKKLKDIEKENNQQQVKKLRKHTNKRIKRIKERLYNLFSSNNEIRVLREDALSKRDIISVFDSVLSRTLGIQYNTLSKDIIVVQTYYYDILEEIISSGFIFDNEKYVCFTASAGQIRTKKTVFIKETVWVQHQKSLMCGLSVDIINQKGGVNINKYLAYLALCNSATDEWPNFDIEKAIVVDDFESDIHKLVDHINHETYVINPKVMKPVTITHTDGCGMILPRKSKKSFMVRLPWIKGLLVPFPFDKFIREANRTNRNKNYGKVTDIYGKEHDILSDGIEVIFTKSQFKMWKYYDSWNEYMDNYKLHNCQAGKCNEEENVIGNAKINYQMLQTLSDISDDELEQICSLTKDKVSKLGNDRKTMLDVLGVTESNNEKNYFQQALEIYPELLNDTYSKETLKNVKKSIIKNAKGGKLDIRGKYTFIIPDLYAFCERLFLKKENPKGLLKDEEVYCILYKSEEKLDCLRSPHLYREHAIRSNVIDKEKARWFITKGLYTSCHDPISKLLQFDCDGDKSLVCADHLLIDIAERNMGDIVPLYYEMGKAEPEEINERNIFKGLRNAYSGGNIGVISNNISKIWNSEDINLDVIKWLCMETNFTVDYAKTLYKPTRPKDIGKQIKKHTKAKVPHFFIYAKDKEKDQVEKINSSVVNRIESVIPNIKLNFKAAGLGKFDYKMLLSDKDITVKLNDEIIKKYTELDLKKHFFVRESDEEDTSDNLFIYRDIRKQILEVNNDLSYVVDVLIEHLYGKKRSSYKTTLWSSFGDVIVQNLKKNVEAEYGNESIQCERCGKRIEATTSNKKYCDRCSKIHRKEYKAEKERSYRKLRGQVHKSLN